jgi:putative hydrolase
MKHILDIHTHTYASGHAYSTLLENCAAAKKAGLLLIASTDHGPAMPGGAHQYFFNNIRVLPEEINGIRVLKGVEANIVNFNGDLDLNSETLSELEFVIASLHIPCIEPGTLDSHTQAILAVMDNPYVTVLGHPGDARYDFDLDKVLNKALEKKILLEINNSSLLPTSFRPGGVENITRLLVRCRELNVPVVLGSDAHFAHDVGHFEAAEELLREVNFPEYLTANTDLKLFEQFLR